MSAVSSCVSTESQPPDLLLSVLKPGVSITFANGIGSVSIPRRTAGLRANQTYFDNTQWREQYLNYVHRDPHFFDRWSVGAGEWRDKIVIDIGCGPGNVAAALGQVDADAKLLIGVDVSMGALESARELGYLPIQADAQDLPFKSGCADIVIANATIHHCDDMAAALSEAARLVAPNGILITDHDPQRSAWNFAGLGLSLWKGRLGIYRLLKRGFHASADQQSVALASEIHHDAGDGVTPELFRSVLEPMGFDIQLYPHNQNLGRDVFRGEWGRAGSKFRITQFLSGINPNLASSALSLMCIARRADGSGSANDVRLPG